MNRYSRIYRKANENGKSVSWIGSALAALAVDIEDATGEQVKLSGPFGLRAEVIVSTPTRLLVVTPSFEGDGLHLLFDTGKQIAKHAQGSLGDFNGFNNEIAPLPNTIYEIIAAMHQL